MHRIPIQSLLSLLALAGPAAAQWNVDFPIDSGATQFTWSGTTSLGDMDEQPPNFTLVGTTGMVLGGGGNPVGTGAFPGSGDALISPNITGEIPAPIPGFPPLATIQLQDTHIQLNSAGFTVDATGGYSTLLGLTLLQGTLIVDDVSGGHSVTDLTGLQSAPTQQNGSLQWDGTQYVLSMPVHSIFPFTDPSSGISGSITLDGTLIAHQQPTAPAVYCNSLMNSSGATGRIAFSGAPSLGAGQLTLHASQLPSNTFGLFFYGTAQSSTPFGNGRLCVGGAIQRLIPVNTGLAGLANQLIDNAGLPAMGQVSAGDSRNFQFWFRDVPAGAAMFNTSDGIAVLYTP